MRKLTFLLFIVLFAVSFSGANAQSCSEQPVRVEHQSFYSDILYGDFLFDVYVPPCMDERILGGYPVVYLLHGQDMDIEIWQKMEMSRIIRETINEADLPLFLTVVPQEDQYLLSPSLSGFEEAFMTELIPWIDEHYNTAADRQHRAIGGLSRGALWAEKIAFEHADRFSSLAMLSMPGSWLDEQSLYFLAEKHKPDNLLRIRLDSGNEDRYRQEAAKVSSELTIIGYPYEYYIQPGEHNAPYWQSRLSDLFVWFSEGWKQFSLP
ncbi:MAG: hypothetical protein IJI07_01830 [Flexilinea sp.]|nr:hypothetical protein [Flexilinea sp.]